MIPTEKLGEECFLENLQLFVDAQTQQEKYNLYKGLAAMSQTLERLFHEVYIIEKQLNSIQLKLEHLSQ